MSQRIHKTMCGKATRWSFSKIKDILPIPYLIEVQKNSYANFIEQGIKDVFADFSPISDYSGKLELEFLDHTFEGDCKYSVKECKDRDATFTTPLKVRVRLTFKETGEIKEQMIFMGDFPRMTENGTFIINGAERVVVSQIVRSPGVYTKGALDKLGEKKYETTVIPNRGAWLEFEQEASGTLAVRVDRTRKITATILLRAIGLSTTKDIEEMFGNDPTIIATALKDNDIQSEEQAKIELYRKLRPGEVPTNNAVDVIVSSTFYDARRYDLSRVGRFKFNQKLSIANRLKGKTLAESVVVDGEILAEAGDVMTLEKAWEIQNAGVNFAFVKTPSGEVHKMIGNNTVKLDGYVGCNPRELGILENVYYPNLLKLIEEFPNKEDLIEAVKNNIDFLVLKHISYDDIIATVSYNLGMRHGFYDEDNIDHLANRRVRSVGELLQNQFRIGIARLERVIKERMSVAQDINEITPTSLINIRPVSSAIREFFGSSQLSQFMDQPNPIAELTHKRKLSALGPGGLNRERAGFEVRDVHHSHYGRMCPIETPEGQNIGLITSLSSYARVNEYGFIEAPYRKVSKDTGIVTEAVQYLTADVEDDFVIAQANEPLDESGRFVHSRVTCRYRDLIKEYPSTQVDYMDVSPQQLVSIATSLIPFLENDDANRALMGSNMQRQAVPLLVPEAPVIGTGMEHKVAVDSGVCVIAKCNGIVKSVTADYIIVENENGEYDRYELQKFRRSNQGTCINQKPTIHKNDTVKKGDIIADGPSIDNGELALGRNILIAFMTWEGYNYEDAILISEDLVKNDVFTSIHIEEYELEARDTKLGEETITRDIPNVSPDLIKHLGEDGIIRIGAEVRAGDYLVGKVAPKGETELTPEERLLRAIFGEKSREVRDVSLKVPHGAGGTVVDVKIFTRENKDELSPGVNQLVRVYIAQKRKISVGDKMAGRHGNKGVISRVLPREDMPFMADGTPMQIVLNPLGVPSRMNIGQVLEVHLGLVAKMLGIKVSTPVFDGATENDIKSLLEENNLPGHGKLQLYDGRTGDPFENPVTVGYMYMLKLVHLVDDKIHARSVGPYSLVTQQPLGGKAQFGGQRFGEMEVWALEAYGAAHILQEILTVKSDDIIGRQKTFDSIIKSATTTEPGLPESFKVLKKELQSLGLDVRLLTDGAEEVHLVDGDEDDREHDAVTPRDDGKEIDFNVDGEFGELFGNKDGGGLFNDNVGGLFGMTEVTEKSFTDGLFEDDEEIFETEEVSNITFNDAEAILQGEFDDDQV